MKGWCGKGISRKTENVISKSWHNSKSDGQSIRYECPSAMWEFVVFYVFSLLSITSLFRKDNKYYILWIRLSLIEAWLSLRSSDYNQFFSWIRQNSETQVMKFICWKGGLVWQFCPTFTIPTRFAYFCQYFKKNQDWPHW